MSATAHQPETREFKAELKQLLHLITHSLYSNKEIFLRELISNASDAINKVRFSAIDHEEMLEGDRDWKIKVTPDKEAGTLTISDNGVGLSAEQAVENLGTIARSGTKAFLEALRQQQASNRPEMIGQFGVGFYSAFMVADKVTVLSRPAGDAKGGVRWESDGQGTYSLEPAEKAARGTDVILHLKAEEKEFLEPYRLRGVIKKFSDFIEFPVVMDVEKEEEGKKTTAEETVNARKAIWLRSPSENTKEEYDEFYKQISHDVEAPAKVVHYSVEGGQEFKALLFIPARRPFEMRLGGDFDWGPKLYVQRVLIMDHCESLLPPYLRFVKGVVDSSDLPLNISREILQESALLDRIRKNLTRAVLKALEEMKGEEYDKYVAFFKELGGVLKEAPRFDWENREKVADLYLFESMKTPAGQFTTLAQYAEAMPEGQKDIWYLTGETREQLEGSPYVETFRAKGQDVLLLTEGIDAVMMPDLRTYKGKAIKPADQGEVGDSPVEASEKVRYAKLLEHLKEKLPEVSAVRLTGRLSESAACLVAGEGQMSAHLERLVSRWQPDAAPGGKRALELNPKHAVVEAMLRLFEKDAGDARVEGYARLLYDQAVIAEGSRVKDPVGLARRINELLVRDAGA